MTVASLLKFLQQEVASSPAFEQVTEMHEVSCTCATYHFPFVIADAPTERNWLQGQLAEVGPAAFN